MASAAPSSSKRNFFTHIHTHPLSFPHHFPFEFASPYSTESESEDEDVTGLTRCFSRSASLKETLYNFKEKQGFSGSPECSLGWSECVPSQVPLPPPFVKSDEDSWYLIYAAAGRVARLKMNTDVTGAGVGVVAYKNNRGLFGTSRDFAHPHCTPWGRADGEEYFRQQRFYRNKGVYGGDNGGCGGRGAPAASFPQSAWPPPQLQTQNRRNQHKPVVHGGAGGAFGGGGVTAKRECAGTGVFLPRRYCNNPPESEKGHARINGGFIPNYEMLMGRRDAMIHRRSNIHGGVKAPPVTNPEMLLPQEWTY